MALKISYNAPVVVTFTLLTTAVYLIDAFLIDKFIINYFTLQPYWDWDNPFWYFRLFSYTLGHMGEAHIYSNMSLFLLLAPIMEEKYGSKNLLSMMVATTLVTAIFQILLFNTALLGASGLVFMFIVLISFADAKKDSIPFTFILVLFLYLGKEIYGSLQNDQVSQYAHIAGGLMGALFGFMGKEQSTDRVEGDY